MNSENTNWKLKLQDLVNTAQSELKKTTAIGMKMISASQANSERHDIMEALGEAVLSAINSGELNWDNEEVKTLVEEANRLENELKNFEDDVQKIKTE